jgi:hypothetical protein
MNSFMPGFLTLQLRDSEGITPCLPGIRKRMLLMLWTHCMRILHVVASRAMVTFGRVVWVQ